MNAASGTLGILLFIFLLILGVLWFLLPFAVFGVKDILNQILHEMMENNKKLDKIIEQKEQ